MLRAVIVDDERPAIHRLQQMLDSRTDVEIVGGFTRASEALVAFPELKPDVAFLDIEMPGRNGLELAAQLLDMHEDLEIVFTTAYSQYALEAFRVNAVDYLLKPVEAGLLGRTIDRIRKRHARSGPIRPTAGEGMRVQCFGSFAVYGRSGEAVRFPTLKAEELFAYFLTCRDADISKWAICEALWPECEPDKAEHNLHTAVYRMKKTLVDNGIRIRLESRKGLYRFELLEPCDYKQLEALRRREAPAGRREREEAADRLLGYRGVLFGDKDYAWCEAEREHVRKGFADFAKQLVRGCLDDDGLETAKALLLLLLEWVPYDETAHEWLLTIYMRQKDRTSFFSHYRKMEDDLTKEMGIAPSHTIKKLHKKMKMEKL